MSDVTTAPDGTPLITLAEAAERVGLELSVARQMLKDGQFCPFYRLSTGRIRIAPSDLEAWLESKRVDPQAPEGAA